MAKDVVMRLEGLMHRLRRLPLFEPRGAMLDVNITLPQMALMQWVADHPGCHVQDLADALGLTAPTISVGVRRLLRAGMLERKPDPNDRRATQLTLTRRAIEMHERFVKSKYEVMGRFLSGLNQSEQKQLLDLLEKAIRQEEEKSALISSQEI